MTEGGSHRQLYEAFERIEESILPSLSVMLDGLLETATLARPGHDGEAFAAELKTLGAQLEALTRQIEAAFPAPETGPAHHRTASAA